MASIQRRHGLHKSENAAVCVAVPPGGPVLAPDEDVLAAFVYPLTVQQFMREHFCKRSVVWRGGMDRVESILNDYLYRGSTKELVRNTASESVHCWLKKVADAANGTVATGAGNLSPQQLDSLKLDDRDQAITAFEAGASLYFRAPQLMHDAFVPALSDCLGMAWAGYYDPGQTQPTGEIEVFVSRTGHTTNWHTDFQQNFTMQVQSTHFMRGFLESLSILSSQPTSLCVLPVARPQALALSAQPRLIGPSSHHAPLRCGSRRSGAAGKAATAARWRLHVLCGPRRRWGR